MASLTQTAILSRKIIRYGLYVIIVIIIGRFALKGAVSVYKTIFPPKTPPPTVSFGKLPEIPFPEKTAPENTNYVLETPDGTLPALPEQVEVYFMPPVVATLKSLENAKDKAQSLRFEPEGRPIVENIQNVYIFNTKNRLSTLTMNIITGVFSINYDVNSNPEVLEGFPLDESAAIEYAKSYLKGAGLLPDDFEESPATGQLLAVESGKYIPAISLSEANLTKVNLFRKKLGDKEIPSVTPDMPEANVWFILSGSGGREIISGEYNYFPLDQSKKSTYPIKTSGQAWEELKNGGAYIANPGDKPSTKTFIRNVYLAYYDPGQYAEFYQPVVVFEGDNNFYAFVPAVTSNYYGRE